MTKKSPRSKSEVDQIEEELWKDWNDESSKATKRQRLLEFHKRELANDRSHVYEALIDCVHGDGVLPGWLRVEIDAIHNAVLDQNGNLHDLFGLESKYPAKGKRAIKARADARLQGKLYGWAHVFIGRGMSKETAIKKAREHLTFPYGQRKSREMFDAQECLLDGYLDALTGVTKHRTK